jgi:hypothetical protein
MQRDANGRLHLAVALYGPWSTALGYDLDWLNHSLPARYSRKCRRIEWGGAWFLQVQLFLPVEGVRQEPVQLHVSAMTGTIWSPELGHFLVERADGVVFVATTEKHRIEAAVESHLQLRRWSAPQRPLIYQFDEPHPSQEERLTPEELAARLALRDHPWFHTYSRERRDVGKVFREIVRRVLDSDPIERPLPAPIELLPA